MNKIHIAIILLFFAVFNLSAQEEPEAVSELIPRELELTPEERLLLAIASKEYPVTPGDVYRLSFLLANEY